MNARARTGWLVTLGGAGLLTVCGLAARGGTVGPAERWVFHAVNGLPDWLYRPLWASEQFGNLAVAFAVLVVVAVVLRKPKLAVAAVVVVVAKLSLERVVKTVVERRRPGSTIGDFVFHEDVPIHGLSFVSGHAVITTAAATMLMAVLPRRWKPVPWIVVGMNGFARVYVGAHNPLDVIGGAGLGLLIGGPMYVWLSRRTKARDAGHGVQATQAVVVDSAVATEGAPWGATAAPSSGGPAN